MIRAAATIILITDETVIVCFFPLIDYSFLSMKKKHAQCAEARGQILEARIREVLSFLLDQTAEKIVVA